MNHDQGLVNSLFETDIDVFLENAEKRGIVDEAELEALTLERELDDEELAAVRAELAVREVEIVPAVALIVVVLSVAWAIRMAPLPKLSAVTIDGSPDSMTVGIETVLPYLSAARALNRKLSPMVSNETVSRETRICVGGPATAMAVKVTALRPETVAVAV